MKKLLVLSKLSPLPERRLSLPELGSQLGQRLFPPATVLLGSKAAEVIIVVPAFDDWACAQPLSSASLKIRDDLHVFMMAAG